MKFTLLICLLVLTYAFGLPVEDKAETVEDKSSEEIIPQEELDETLKTRPQSRSIFGNLFNNIKIPFGNYGGNNQKPELTLPLNPHCKHHLENTQIANSFLGTLGGLFGPIGNIPTDLANSAGYTAYMMCIRG